MVFCVCDEKYIQIQYVIYLLMISWTQKHSVPWPHTHWTTNWNQVVWAQKRGLCCELQLSHYCVWSSPHPQPADRPVKHLQLSEKAITVLILPDKYIPVLDWYHWWWTYPCLSSNWMINCNQVVWCQKHGLCPGPWELRLSHYWFAFIFSRKTILSRSVIRIVSILANFSVGS